MINERIITDVTGHIIFRSDEIKKDFSPTFKIELKEKLSTGIYFINFKCKSGLITSGKIIVTD